MLHISGLPRAVDCVLGPKRAGKISVHNPALNWAGVYALTFKPGVGAIRTTAVALSLQTLKPQNFRFLLELCADPDYELQIDREVSFVRYLQMIADPVVREFTERALELAPNEFFIKPSSMTTSAHHPLDEYAVGGQVLHSNRTARLGFWIYNQLFLEDRAELSQFVSAMLLHDIVSHAVERSDGRLVFSEKDIDHGVKGGVWLEKLARSEFGYALEKLLPVCRMVYYHMGRWGKETDTTLTKENSCLEWLVAATDMIAALPRSYVSLIDLPAWSTREMVFSQVITAEKFDRRPLPVDIRWSALSRQKQIALVIAKEMFRQYAVVDYGTQDKIIAGILNTGSLLQVDKQRLAEEVDYFIACVSLAAAMTPVTVFDTQVNLADLGIIGP